MFHDSLWLDYKCHHISINLLFSVKTNHTVEILKFLRLSNNPFLCCCCYFILGFALTEKQTLKEKGNDKEPPCL